MSLAEAEMKHHEAMGCLDRALDAQRRGDETTRRTELQRAWSLESEAAQLVANLPDLEPTRAILHRSAANLALQCGQLEQAEKLIAVGLAGDPPEDVAEELRELLEQVNRLKCANGEHSQAPAPTASLPPLVEDRSPK
jgi:hypothetical protein